VEGDQERRIAGIREFHRKLTSFAELYASADGDVVSAECNHSIPPGLSNLIDYFIEEYAFRPSVIFCYSVGPFGGVRAAMQLRALLPEVGMSPIPSMQVIPRIVETLDCNGIALIEEFAQKSGRFFDDFDWYMRAMKTERQKGLPH
jgi:NAD(P)H-dependent FMN reductase